MSVALGVLGTAAWFAVPLLFSWLGINGLKTGIVKTPHGPLAKAESPFVYWLVMAMHVGLVGFWLWATLSSIWRGQ